MNSKNRLYATTNGGDPRRTGSRRRSATWAQEPVYGRTTQRYCGITFYLIRTQARPSRPRRAIRSQWATLRRVRSSSHTARSGSDTAK